MTHLEFLADIDLMVSNALQYNPDTVDDTEEVCAFACVDHRSIECLLSCHRGEFIWHLH